MSTLLQELLNEMTLKEIISVKDLSKVLKDKCAKVLPALSDKTLVYRGTDSSVLNKQFFITDVRKDRKPKDTHPALHVLVDQYFEKKFGKKYRSQSVFVDRDVKVTRKYGNKIYSIVPVGDFSCLYSEKTSDLYGNGLKALDFDESIKKPEKIDIDWIENVVVPLDSYRIHRIEEAFGVTVDELLNLFNPIYKAEADKVLKFLFSHPEYENLSWKIELDGWPYTEIFKNVNDKARFPFMLYFWKLDIADKNPRAFSVFSKLMDKLEYKETKNFEDTLASKGEIMIHCDEVLYVRATVKNIEKLLNAIKLAKE